MYYFFKKNIKKIIPIEFLVKNELIFRWFYGIFFLGEKHQCNICNKKLRTFIKLKTNDLLCPFCGSLSRNRRLWQLLTHQKKLNGNLLHFSPSRSLYRKLKKEKAVNYFSTDYENEFLADYKFDITKINQESNKFDIIICYHILEHVIEDTKAMLELHRVLKPNGTIYIQTPFKEGDIYEDYSITLEEDRLMHFGQRDHVRIYSIQGLKNRLEQKKLYVKVISFNHENNDVFYGFKSPETILTVTKK